MYPAAVHNVSMRIFGLVKVVAEDFAVTFSSCHDTNNPLGPSDTSWY